MSRHGAAGVGAAAAIAAAALVGPAQVLARMVEYGVAHRFRLHPLMTARLASVLHPAAGVGLLVLGGTPAVAAGLTLTVALSLMVLMALLGLRPARAL